MYDSILHFLFHTNEGKAACIGFIAVLIGSVIGAGIILLVQFLTIFHSDKRDLNIKQGDSYVKLLYPMFGELTHTLLYAPADYIKSFLNIQIPRESDHNLGPLLLSSMAKRLSINNNFLSMAQSIRNKINPDPIDDVQVLKFAILNINIQDKNDVKDPLFWPYSMSIMGVYKELFALVAAPSSDENNFGIKTRELRTKVFGPTLNAHLNASINRINYCLLQIHMSELSWRVQLMIFNTIRKDKPSIDFTILGFQTEIEAIISNNLFQDLYKSYLEKVAPLLFEDSRDRFIDAANKLILNFGKPIGDLTFS